MPELHIENLKPQNTRTKEEQREIATLGGIASGKARKEKKLLSQIYMEFLSERLKIKKSDGSYEEMEAPEYVRECIKRGLYQKPSAMLKEIREATEGSKLDISSPTVVVFDERFKKI